MCQFKHPTILTARARPLQPAAEQLQIELDDLRARARLFHKRVQENQVSFTKTAILDGLWSLGSKPESIKYPEFMP